MRREKRILGGLAPSEILKSEVFHGILMEFRPRMWTEIFLAWSCFWVFFFLIPVLNSHFSIPFPGWAHVVCALYIPEVQFANVLTMEPIVLQYVPHDRFNKTCYICEEQGRESKAASGACMACNRHGCRQAFPFPSAQMAGLLCEEEVLEVDNVKYCGYCKYHFSKMKTSRHSGSSSFLPGRRSRSASPTQEKHLSHHERPKKVRLSWFEQPLRVPCQGSGGHHEATKDSSEVARAEAKGRKSSSHGSSHKGKKTGSGKSSGGFGTAAPGGTFQAAGEGREEEEEREEGEEGKDEGKRKEGGWKRRGGAGGATSAGHKRLPSLSAEEGELLKEKKHKGSKKNKHGPGRPKAGKGKEVLGAQLAGSTSTSSSPFSGGSLVSSSVGSSSRSFGHASSLPSLSVESPLLGS
ncbi:PREDICTED: protein AF-17-like, partial [Ficedula albicollis]|uniref:protein AF-17-like n=1 Tax=Ficedula albicollis TaxID=59894 RepID=UPI0007AD882B